ncbi:MAG: hypothetical protein MSIBF_05075 [Candidatus Altiarchaeales archaeon IMC4]|nr:MAG: hypothetical protein MSIBF_05075 [Candidatus Altiarchaeales archaeon IMC4]
MIPTIKKDVASFLLEEKGEVSKHQIISFGALLSGLAALNIMTKVVAGQNISALHDHCDPGHGSGWYGSAHSNADAQPVGHCNINHGSYGGWATSANAAHNNNIVLNYG